MNPNWQAQYFDGSSAAVHRAVVTLLPDSIEIKTEESTCLWPYKEVTQTQGFYSGEPIRLERGKEAIVIIDRSIADTLPKKKVRNSKGPLRGTRLAIYLPVLLVIGLSITSLFYFKVIPSAAGFVADIIPASLEEQLGLSAEMSFLANFDEYENPEVTKNVKSIMAVLETATGQSRYDFKLNIVDAPIKNAYALPGGRIVLFRGLIEETDSAEELAGVLAHEMAHTLKKHPTKGMLHQLSTYMLFSFMTGDVNSVAAVAQNLGTLRYSREAETEADGFAARLLMDADIDPKGLVSFFTATDKKKGAMAPGFNYLSTHPNADRRVQLIEDTVSAYAANTDFSPLLPGVDWKELTTSVPVAPTDAIHSCAESNGRESGAPESYLQSTATSHVYDR